MTFAFTKATYKLAKQLLGDLETADLRVALVKGGNDCVAERDIAEFMGDLNLDEHDGTNYARQQLDNQVLGINAAIHGTEFVVDPTIFPGLGEGSGDPAGAVVYLHVGLDSVNPVLFFYDDGGFPKPATGDDYPITWSSGGIARFIGA